MSAQRRGRRVRHEAGAALLLLMLVVLIASSGLLLAKANGARAALARDSTTQAALAAAKRHLIDYALTHADRQPGQGLQLPCPDIDGGGSWLDGEAHTASCGAAGVSMLGRFPWRSVGVRPPLDASASCLWYAVSGSYKGAGGATAAMINADANGQLQIFDAGSGGVIGSGLPDDRSVAVLLAPLEPLAGQTRSSGTPNDCGPSFAAADHLDSVATFGISNAVLSGTPDAIEQLIAAAAPTEEMNDRLLTISRLELADAVYRRPDHLATMENLTRGVASCIAAYGLSNPGGATDRRLPWPAQVPMTDYALAASYDDVDVGVFSGRLADIVDDSNTATGNAILRVLSDCDPALAPDWDPSFMTLWQHWKDHLFYAVAESFQPAAPVPSSCGACLTVNGSGSFAAVVMFANRRLPALGQRRDAPPLDADTRDNISNYLEGANALSHPYSGGAADFDSGSLTATFNDVLYCVDPTMNVAAC